MAKGFGKPPEPRKISESAIKRQEAAQQLEQMKSEGMPAYQIFVRPTGTRNWMTVGEIAVKRSDQVNFAIRDNRPGLTEAAVRGMPALKKYVDRLEFGYRLAEFKDEPITPYEEPKLPIPNPLAGVGDFIGNLFKKKA